MKKILSVSSLGVEGHTLDLTPCTPKSINCHNQLPLFLSGCVCLLFLLAQSPSGWAARLSLTNYSETTGATIILKSNPGETWQVEYTFFDLTTSSNTVTPLGVVEINQAGFGQIVDLTAATVSQRIYGARMLAPQPTYNCNNTVGFLKAQVLHGFSLLGNPFADSFPVSQITNLPEGVLIWKPSGLSWELNWYSQTLGWGNPDMQLNLGQAFWIYNPGTARSIVFKGEHAWWMTGVQSTNSLATVVGRVNWVEFVACSSSSYLVLKYNPVTQSYEVCTFDDFDWDDWSCPLNFGDAFYWVRESSGPNPCLLSGLVTSPIITAPGITFANYSGPVVESCSGGTPVSGGRFRGQVYAGTNWIENQMVPVSSPVAFLSGTLAGYIPPVLATLPFCAQGQSIILQLRAWDYTASPTYESALSNHARTGKSDMIHVIHSGCILGGITLSSNFNSFTINTGTAVTARVRDRVSIEICGSTGTKYEVQWADVLATNGWQVLTNFTLPYSPFQIIDADATGKPQRFYRTLLID